MANENNEEVKEFVEKVSIEGKPGDGNEDDDEIIKPEGSSPAEKSDEDEKDDTDTSKKDELITKKIPADKTDDGIVELEGETPRERALRLEVTRLKARERQDRKGDIEIRPGNSTKTELSDEQKKVLARYKPEDIQNLKEVFGVMAEDMGFVRKDQLGASTYTDKATEELDKFIDAHPEYLPENDTDNLLWGRFKEEYSLYKQPENPKEFKKIFERVHQSVFGIKSAGDDKTINAAKEKVKVASHSGASKPGGQSQRANAPTGIRFDMLKGFTDEERAELEGNTK